MGRALISLILLAGALAGTEGGAGAQVAINEVYYDHPGDDRGHEFVELINLLSVDLCLQGLQLEFHNGALAGYETLWVAAAGDTIPAGGLFVIGGDSVYPPPEHSLELGLQNGPDGVRLTWWGTSLDVLGYGTPLGDDYREGASAPDVGPGWSLGRVPDGSDTDDNSVDFHCLPPSPGSFNLPRIDLALHRDGPDAVAVERGRSFSVRVWVENEGRISSPPFQVTWWDSTTRGREEVGRDYSSGLAPGDSAALARSFFFTPGYHFLVTAVEVDGDQRSSNNRAVTVVRVGKIEVLVNELMCYPKPGCPQYVEIYNLLPEPVPLTGWRLRDAAHDPVSIPSWDLEGEGYLVLCEDPSALIACFPGLDPAGVVEVSPWPHFNRSDRGEWADSVVLYDAHGLVVDGAAYPPPGEPGRSLERLAPSVWGLSAAPSGGTPGGPNSLGIAPAEGRVEAEPNPFFPSRNQILVLKVGARSGTARVVAAVFDLEGVLVRDLGCAGRVPCVFRWDGRSQEGLPVPAGLYVVACQFFDVEGIRVDVGKVVIGCGR